MYAVVIGGTRFVGRHTVQELLDRGYHVRIVNRGRHPNPFQDEPKVEHVRGDRNDRSTLRAATEGVTPDIVIDCVAYLPQQVAAAVDSFANVDSYVYVSSAGVYRSYDVPRREDTTPLEPYDPSYAVDDPSERFTGGMHGYSVRKAEGDRVCFAAADDGVNAMVVRPTYVFGPHDYTHRFDYWIDRVASAERVLVPGDGDALAHQIYVEDLADALVTVAESGTPGEAYNAGARQLLTLDERLHAIAEALETDVELVHADDRDLSAFDLSVDDFPLVGSHPSVLSTAKLADLGWTSTPHDVAIQRTVVAFEPSMDRYLPGPSRDRTRRVIESTGT